MLGFARLYLSEKSATKPIAMKTWFRRRFAHRRVRRLVSIGDFVTFRQSLRKLQNGRVAGKALDNRASVTAVTICLEHLQQRRHTWDVIAVATSQEEETFPGLQPSATPNDRTRPSPST